MDNNIDLDEKIGLLIKDREYLYIIASLKEDENEYFDYSNHYRVYYSGDVAIFRGKKADNEFYSKFKINNIIPIKKEDKCFNLFLCNEFNFFHLDLIKEKFKKLTGKTIRKMELRFNYLPYFKNINLFDKNRKKYYQLDSKGKKVYIFVPVLKDDFLIEIKEKIRQLKKDKKNCVKIFKSSGDNMFNCDV
jgi:hypothetical protein